ncbi:MAG: alcohol dehydrogenase [Cereibacter sp.]|jgi:mono/diheme cytochrome c family protein|nr:alcohol dehydrogenase [Cereibacter sp.]
MSLLRWAGTTVSVLAVVAVAGVAFAWRGSIDPVARPDPASFDPAEVRRGAELAAVGNCIACHTVPGGQAFAGGLALPTPFGTIHSTNITPDEETGIGAWSEAAFQRSMHEGVDRSGAHLYPAFPYDHFTLVSEEDNRALYAYLMTRAPVRAEAQANDLPFPLNIRMMIAGWKLLFFDEGRFAADAAQGEDWNRGAYLAEGLGHCGACHTPRNALGARKAGAEWSGGEAEGWTAYPINALSPAPVPWDAEALTFYLRQGWHPEHGVSRGPMAEVTGNLGLLPDSDIAAIAAYTASRMGEPDAARLAQAETAREAAAAPPEASTRGAGQEADTQVTPAAAGDRGAAIYGAACASCHESGRPQPYGGLSFHLSTAVNADNPQNIVNVTLFGLPPADGQASAVMPAYRGMLSDGDVVSLLNYLRDRFTDLPPWEGLEDMVADTRSGAHHVAVRPADGIERGPSNIGAETE